MIRKTIRGLLIAALGCTQSIAHSADDIEPPDWPVADIKKSEATIQPVTGITIGSFKVKLDQTTFKDVTANLGSAPFHKRGDAAEFQMWVCYTLPQIRTRLWLTASELGGEEYIDGFVAKLYTHGINPAPECPVLRNSRSHVVIDKGIWLNTSIKEIKKALGEPNRTSKSVIYYSYEGKEGEYDIASDLAIRVCNGIATELYAAHSKTN